MVIQTHQLTRKYGKMTVVNQVNLEVPKGEIYGFLGPNGAGKTTTLRMLLGLIRPTSGSIRIFGEDLRRNRLSILRRVGALVESPSYYGHLTGRENLEVFRRLIDAPKSRIDEVLEIVRLKEAAHRPVKGYSLGMKQRLGIAIALLGNPELLILDEPTNGLDPAGIQEIRQLIKEMPGQYGITVLVSSHLLSEVEQIATRVGILSKGKLIFQDSIQALRSHSQSRLRIGVDKPREARQYLLTQEISAELEGDHLVIRGSGRTLAGEVNRLLVMQGFTVYQLQEIHPSLEEIFLQLTGKEGS